MLLYLPPSLLSAIPIDGLTPEEVRALLCRVREELHDELVGSNQLIHPTMVAHVAATIREGSGAGG